MMTTYINGIDTEEIWEWLTENVGPPLVDWEWGIIRTTYPYGIEFRNEEDAIIFKLKYGSKW